MNKSVMQIAVAVAAAGALQLAHAAGCPWLGENVPYDAAADTPADSAQWVVTPAPMDSSYEFSEANFPPMASADAPEPVVIAQFDPLEAP
jgi:hypothetical protein